MKITKFLFASMFVSALTFVSCTNNDDIVEEEAEEAVVILSGELNTMSLTKDKKYLIQGQTFVTMLNPRYLYTIKIVDGKIHSVLPFTKNENEI